MRDDEASGGEEGQQERKEGGGDNGILKYVSRNKVLKGGKGYE